MSVVDGFVLLRGGGDLATGVAYRLHRAGVAIVVLELSRPLVVRRRVALAAAVLEGEVKVEELLARRVSSLAQAQEQSQAGVIPVLVSPALPDWQVPITDSHFPTSNLQPPAPILIDARMAKRKLDTRIDQARLVIALGPGFTAGADCHAVIETKRGHWLGRVIWEGSAEPDTGTPGIVAGKGAERVLRAPGNGEVDWQVEIGDLANAGQILGWVGKAQIRAPFDGVLRGLIAPGTTVPAGLKIGDLDARADPSACFTISDKALAVGGGVLEAILTWQHQFG